MFLLSTSAPRCATAFSACAASSFLKVLGAMHLAAWEYGKPALLNALSKTKRQLIGSHVEALLVNSKNGTVLVDESKIKLSDEGCRTTESMGWRS